MSFSAKKWRFTRKNPWKTSGALFGIFYRDCVSDFHIASEFSKQSNFWFVWRNRCCLWKGTIFSPKSVNVAFFSQLAFQKNINAQENWKRSTAWDFQESRLVIWKNCLYFSKIADIGNISIDCVSNCFFAWNFSKNSNFGFFWKNRLGCSENEAWTFLKTN